MSLTFQGIHQDILDDETPERCVLGARDSGKTTVCVYDEIQCLVENPKLKSFLFRFSDQDTQSKLVPFVREMSIDEFGVVPDWDNKELCFNYPNGSIAYMFGLRATTSSQRYSKMRGLGVGRVFSEQAEELPSDIGLELRAALRQPGFNHLYQLTYCANPPPRKHWLLAQFPQDQRFKNRKLFLLSLYDNAHNLSAETIRQLEQAFPPEHPKHRTIILGLPGVNVTGEPVYGDVFRQALHVRPIAYDPSLPLLEGFDLGKLNPCWLVGQRPYSGGLHWLGGILGQDMFLEDFIPIVREKRAEWFPDLRPRDVRTCCTLSVNEEQPNPIGMEQLREAGFFPQWKSGSNSPDTVLSLIERQASYLRRRGAKGVEMLGVNNAEDRWLMASREGIESSQFMAEAYGGGYAWNEKTVSVGRNEMKQPEADAWFEHAMRAAEAIELNFSVGQESDAQREQRLSAARLKQAESLQSSAESPHSWLAW